MIDMEQIGYFLFMEQQEQERQEDERKEALYIRFRPAQPECKESIEDRLYNQQD